VNLKLDSAESCIYIYRSSANQQWIALVSGDALKDEKIAPSKLYYSISEVAKITDVKAYVLRFWEKEFPTLKPRKNRSGNRIYQVKEIELVRQIKKLLYDEGYTIEGARQQLRNGRRNRMKAGKKGSQPPSSTSSLAAIKKEIQSLIQLLS